MVAEEQPVSAQRLAGGTFLKKGAERRDAGARTNLDHWMRQALRPNEAVGLLHMDAEPAARLDALTQKG